MEFIQLDVEIREKKGSAFSRKLRQAGRVPAALYGLGRENRDLSISTEDFEDFVKSGSRLVELKLGEKTQQAILRAVQLDPLTDAVLHVDLVRIDKDHEIEADVPIETKGIPKGLSEGGVFETVLARILVRCTPARLPEKLVLDVGHLALNQAITIKDLKLPEGVKTLHHKPDDHVAHCVPQKIVSVEPVAAAEGATPAEPERIGGKKPEEGVAGEEGGKPSAKKDEKKEEKREDKGEKSEKSEKKDKK